MSLSLSGRMFGHCGVCAACGVSSDRCVSLLSGRMFGHCGVSFDRCVSLLSGRMFGHCGVCAACGVGIPASEFVMRIGGGLVYHIRCFSCSKCNAALSRGDRYMLVNGAPVCEQDANKLFPPPVKKGKVGRPRRQRD